MFLGGNVPLSISYMPTKKKARKFLTNYIIGNIFGDFLPWATLKKIFVCSNMTQDF